MAKKYKSKFTRGGSALRPDVLELTDKKLIYTKRNSNLIGKDEKSILIADIVEISIDTHLIGADLILKTQGLGRIKISNFDKDDIREIQKEVEQKQASLKSANQPKASARSQRIVEKETKSEKVQLEELRIKSEKEAEKQNQKRYRNSDEIPFIKFTSENVLDELQKLIQFYKVELNSNSGLLYNHTKKLITAYKEKIKEGINFLQNADIKKNELDFINSEYDECVKIHNELISNAPKINRKYEIKNWLIYGSISIIAILLFYFWSKSDGTPEYSEVKLRYVETGISGNISEYLSISKDTSTLLLDKIEKIKISLNVNKKFDVKLSNYNFKSKLHFYNKDTASMSVRPFDIEYHDIEKLSNILEKGKGKVVITFDGYIGLEDKKRLQDESTFFSIDMDYKK